MKFIELNNSVVNVEHIIELFLEKVDHKERTLIRFRGNDKFIEIVNYKFAELKKILLEIDQPPAHLPDEPYRYF